MPAYLINMLPQFYQVHLKSQLSKNQYILLNLLIELLQSQKQVRLERLAANLPLPIQFESRRRQLQRFLISPKVSISSIWFAIINSLLMRYFLNSKKLIIVIDRTLRARVKYINGEHSLESASYSFKLANIIA